MNFSIGIGYHVAFGIRSSVEQKGDYSRFESSTLTYDYSYENVPLDDQGQATNHFISQLGLNVGYELVIRKRIGLLANYIVDYSRINKLNYAQYDAAGDGYGFGIRYHFR